MLKISKDRNCVIYFFKDASSKGYQHFLSTGYVSFLLYTFMVLFVFVALRPMSTAMVIAGRSVHLTTLFPGQA